MSIMNNNDDNIEENAFQELHIMTKHGISHILQVGLRDVFTKKSAYHHVPRVLFVVPGKLIFTFFLLLFLTFNNNRNAFLLKLQGILVAFCSIDILCSYFTRRPAFQVTFNSLFQAKIQPCNCNYFIFFLLFSPFSMTFSNWCFAYWPCETRC